MHRRTLEFDNVWAPEGPGMRKHAAGWRPGGGDYPVPRLDPDPGAAPPPAGRDDPASNDDVPDRPDPARSTAP